MSALIAVSSLAVDYGRAQLARSEVQACADSAARAAASGISTSLSTARTRGKNVASFNEAAGNAIVLSDGDFVFGRWNAMTNVLDAATGSSIDAVQVTVSRTVELPCASTFGNANATVVARATARMPSTAGFTGYTGLDGVQFKNNAFVGSYRSSVTTNPATGTSTGKGNIASNGIVAFKNNGTVNGDVTLGPSGELEYNKNLTVTGQTITRPSALTAPADPAWNPTANPGGVPQSYSVNSITTLPGGTYWFTSLTLKKKLTFSGAVTMYVNGNIDMDESIATYSSLPSNLKIYQIGNNRVFDIKKDTQLVAEVQAPRSTLVGHNKLYFHGSGIFKSIEAKTNCEFFYDEDASSAGPSGGISLVK